MQYVIYDAGETQVSLHFWLEDVHYDTRKRESRDMVNHLFLNDRLG